jgi:hypothetical protein
MRAVMALSKAEDEANWSHLAEAIRTSVMEEQAR